MNSTQEGPRHNCFDNVIPWFTTSNDGAADVSLSIAGVFGSKYNLSESKTIIQVHIHTRHHHGFIWTTNVEKGHFESCSGYPTQNGVCDTTECSMFPNLYTVFRKYTSIAGLFYMKHSQNHGWY